MKITAGMRLKVSTLINSKPQIDRDAFEHTGQRIMLPIIPAGTVYRGVASDVDHDGFFDLNFDDGNALCFYAHDDAILIEHAERR